jgi:hypothetical protein
MPSETKTFTAIRELSSVVRVGLPPQNLLAWAALAIAGFLLALTGFASTVDIGIFGLSLTLVSISGALTWCVRSGGPLKRALEVVLLLGAFGTLFYGYFLTGSMFLAVPTVFISIMMLAGFILSYVLPKVRGKLSKL